MFVSHTGRKINEAFHKRPEIPDELHRKVSLALDAPRNLEGSGMGSAEDPAIIAHTESPMKSTLALPRELPSSVSREALPTPMMGPTDRYPSPALSNVSRGGDQLYIHDEMTQSPDATLEYALSPQRPPDEWPSTIAASYYQGQNLYYQSTDSNITNSESQLNQAFQLSSGTPPPEPPYQNVVPNPGAVIPNTKGCLLQTNQSPGDSFNGSNPLLPMQYVNVNLETGQNAAVPKQYLPQGLVDKVVAKPDLAAGKDSPPHERGQPDVSLPTIEPSNLTHSRSPTDPPATRDPRADSNLPLCTSTDDCMMTPSKTDRQKDDSFYTPPEDEGKTFKVYYP